MNLDHDVMNPPLTALDRPPPPIRRRPATQKMVAEKAGVSPATVSHILTGRGDRYREETRRKVIAAVEELGHHPNRAAQTIRRDRTNLIGIIHFGVAFESIRQTAMVLPGVIESRGYELLVLDLSWQPDGAMGAVRQLVESRVEGVIICQMRETFGKECIDILRRAGIPVVIIAGNEEFGVPIVYSDAEKAMREMTEHLMSLGHRRMLLLVDQHLSRSSSTRVKGFSQAIVGKGGQEPKIETEKRPIMEWLRSPVGKQPSGRVIRIHEDPATQAGSHFHSGYFFTRDLVEADLLPEVLLCTNDLWALGVFSAVLGAGKSVPRDVAITGFDNEVFGRFAPYDLTTIAHPREEECLKATEVLFDLIAGRTFEERCIVLPCRLIVRASCGAAVRETKI